MVGLPNSKKLVIRTGDVGEDGSIWREERIERLMLLKDLGRLITDFFRLLTGVGEPGPCSCMTIIYFCTAYPLEILGFTFWRGTIRNVNGATRTEEGPTHTAAH